MLSLLPGLGFHITNLYEKNLSKNRIPIPKLCN